MSLHPSGPGFFRGLLVVGVLALASTNLMQTMMQKAVPGKSDTPSIKKPMDIDPDGIVPALSPEEAGEAIRLFNENNPAGGGESLESAKKRGKVTEPLLLDPDGCIEPTRVMGEHGDVRGNGNAADRNPGLTPKEAEAERVIKKPMGEEERPKEQRPATTTEPIYREQKNREPNRGNPPSQRSAPSLEPLYVERGIV